MFSSGDIDYVPYPRIKTSELLDFELSDLCKVTPISETDEDTRVKEKQNNDSTQKTPETLPCTKPRNAFESRAYEAFKRKKIFTVYGRYGIIRRALMSRGWIEKLPPDKIRRLQLLQDHAQPGEECEAAMTLLAVSGYPSFFIWQPKIHHDYNATKVLPYRNRLRRAPQIDFSTKIGLIGCVESSHWHGEYDLNYPRFYRLDNKEDIPRFTEDFQTTQCLSLLSFVCDAHNPADLADYRTGTIKLATLNFAIKMIEKKLRQENCSIDDPHGFTKIYSGCDELEWLQFLMGSNMIVKRLNKFNSNESQLVNLVLKAKMVLEAAKYKYPTIRIDGYRNLWILKPGYKCRGLGISIMGNLNAILDFASKRFRSKYIVQKYIERPFLIYKTKFDLRQFLLVSITKTTVDIWIYRNCYLRFSSQEYSFDNLNEAVHITNNSVQKKYKNGKRDSRLPANNMWSLLQFKEFLISNYGSNNIWDEKIKPGIVQNLLSIVLSSLEETVLTPKAFELYGCDLMLDEQLKPILIEVNSTPDMSPSTSVTAYICNEALKDLIKVIVDLPLNSTAPTGDFELVHQINRVALPSSSPSSLSIVGKACKLFSREPIKKIHSFRKKLTHQNKSNILKIRKSVSSLHKLTNKVSKKKLKLHSNRLNSKLIIKSQEGSDRYWRCYKGSKLKVKMSVKKARETLATNPAECHNS